MAKSCLILNRNGSLNLLGLKAGLCFLNSSKPDSEFVPSPKKKKKKKNWTRSRKDGWWCGVMMSRWTIPTRVQKPAKLIDTYAHASLSQHRGASNTTRETVADRLIRTRSRLTPHVDVVYSYYHYPPGTRAQGHLRLFGGVSAPVRVGRGPTCVLSYI